MNGMLQMSASVFPSKQSNVGRRKSRVSVALQVPTDSDVPLLHRLAAATLSGATAQLLSWLANGLYLIIFDIC